MIRKGERNMKVLMLHDCAYVGYELSKELRKLGVTVDHLQYHNKLGFNFKKLRNIFNMFKKSVTSDADLIHAHYLGTASRIAYFTGIPYVVHCHGSDVRNKRLSRKQKKWLKKAKVILYSTPDLKQFLPTDAVYLPTPIGEQFKDLNIIRFIPDAYRVLKYEKNQNGFGLKNIPYSDMPDILNTIETFHDRRSIHSLSKTGLEALACGCKVIDFNDNWRYGGSHFHKASIIAAKLKQIYEGILNDS